MPITKKGDTLIEVVLSFVMFSLVTAISISVMHAGISSAEASIELTLARTEIDTQAETMRFIQESFANDRTYQNLWKKITERALYSNESSKAPKLDTANCNELYGDFNDEGAKTIYDAKAFILNPRRIGNGMDPNKSDYYENTLILAKDSTDKKFTTSSLNPRVIYTTESSNSITTDDVLDESEEFYDTVYRAEGIYGFLIKDTNSADPNAKPTHYDFYVYTCWVAPGAERPTTIGTVTRLFNPEFLGGK